MKRFLGRWLVIISLFFPLISGCSALKKLMDKKGSETTSSDSSKAGPSTNDSGNVLKSGDGSSQITLIEGWKEQKGLNEKAELQAADAVNNNFIIVLSESKMDFKDMTLDKHSEATRSILLKAITNPVVEGPTSLTINGYPAVQYKITGTIDNLNPVYLHTTVETPKNFHQILAWTLASKFDKNKDALTKMIESFKEVGK